MEEAGSYLQSLPSIVMVLALTGLTPRNLFVGFPASSPETSSSTVWVMVPDAVPQLRYMVPSMSMSETEDGTPWMTTAERLDNKSPGARERTFAFSSRVPMAPKRDLLLPLGTLPTVSAVTSTPTVCDAASFRFQLWSSSKYLCAREGEGVPASLVPPPPQIFSRFSLLLLAHTRDPRTRTALATPLSPASPSTYTSSPLPPSYEIMTWLELAEAWPTFLSPGQAQSFLCPLAVTWRSPVG